MAKPEEDNVGRMECTGMTRMYCDEEDNVGIGNPQKDYLFFTGKWRRGMPIFKPKKDSNIIVPEGVEHLRAQEEMYPNLVSPKKEVKQNLCKDAFLLMWYKCEECGVMERVWNSRPRVTPFCIDCRHCKEGVMMHVDWKLDEYNPDHIPSKGDRVFIDMPRELAKHLCRKRIEEEWESDTPLCELFSSKEEALESFMKDFKFGQPMLETV